MHEATVLDSPDHAPSLVARAIANHLPIKGNKVA
jgi:hypothetical protein